MTIDAPGQLSAFSRRAYYAATIREFLAADDAVIVDSLTRRSEFAIDLTQRDAWLEQIRVLRQVLGVYANDGWLAFEYTVPRIGRRIDVLLAIGPVLFVLEFKVGECHFTADATDQVWDYALDLKNFHSESHGLPIAPILIATQAPARESIASLEFDQDQVLRPLHASPGQLRSVIDRVRAACSGQRIELQSWAMGKYQPTPTIIEAATALYRQHSVEEISRSDASAINLSRTSAAIQRVIQTARDQRSKALCLVTGVPGAGKTLVGLDIATKNFDEKSELYSVFLSGNGPLVKVLRGALYKDSIQRAKKRPEKFQPGELKRQVDSMIQPVHHFRDDYLAAPHEAPPERVTIFDEAQRAWNHAKTEKFMREKKKHPGFTMSEPEFLISCMDRHRDWAVVVCLVGGGQEINTGEAGIGEWIRAVTRAFPDWHVHLSPHLHDSEYAAGDALDLLQSHAHVHRNPDLHLSVSMRAFRSENVSAFIKQTLDQNAAQARDLLGQLQARYPIVLTRNLHAAKTWLRAQARGSERFGMVASSGAKRLKPHAVDIRTEIDPIHWFLHPKHDVRSSYYLEDVATEFQVQGLELDWVCVMWDGDFRYTHQGWEHWSFSGSKWKRIRAEQAQAYLKNAYRVLLTRARQGMVIVVPEGDAQDPTRDARYYDATFDYLRTIGLQVINP